MDCVKTRMGYCYLDENGVFCRDRKVPIYADIDCVDRQQVEVLRDNWLSLISSGKLSESNCWAVQLLVDDLDFLIRGGKFFDD